VLRPHEAFNEGGKITVKREDIDEIRRIGEIIEKIAKDERSFKALVEAHESENAEAFQAELARLDLQVHCESICYWICFKKCVLRCEFLCPAREIGIPEIDVEEMRKFALDAPRLIRDEETLTTLLEAYDKRDAQAFQGILERFGLLHYCKQICSWFCHIRCRRVCIKLCPPPPLITHVGLVPTGQFKPSGFANGPNDPLFGVGHTPAPNVAAGVGDHPFGSWVNIKGLFNISNAEHYRIEYKKGTDPWTPITTVMDDRYFDFPWNDCAGFFCQFTRSTETISGFGDGWYKIPFERGVSPPASATGMGYDLGPPANLTNWNTLLVSDGNYQLRLTVKKGSNTYMSPVITLIVDNTSPMVDQPEVYLEKPDGSVVQLGCCGEVHKGDGIIQIKIRAFDKNFSRLTLHAYGGCSGDFPIVDLTTGNIVDKTYNGDIVDEGISITRIVRWNPWSGPGLECCCYIVWLQIWDRAVLNDNWGGGHYGAKFVALKVC
jgi:hypothetical protein